MAIATDLANQLHSVLNQGFKDLDVAHTLNHDNPLISEIYIGDGDVSVKTVERTNSDLEKIHFIRNGNTYYTYKGKNTVINDGKLTSDGNSTPMDVVTLAAMHL